MPVGEHIVLLSGVTAAEAMTSHRGHFVYLSSATQVSLCDAAGNDALVSGVLLNQPASGEVAEVATFGSRGVLCKVDGNAVAVTVGGKIKANIANTGIGLQTVTDTDTSAAIAREVSTADDDFVKCDLRFGTLSI